MYIDKNSELNTLEFTNNFFYEKVKSYWPTEIEIGPDFFYAVYENWLLFLLSNTESLL